MKRSYYEIFRRHPFLLSAPMVVSVVIAAAFALSQPRTYTSSSTVWSDAPIPNNSTLLQGVGNSTPPSGTQQSDLTELLGTRSFLLDVARHSPIAHYVSTHSGQPVDAALAAIAKSVTMQTPGPQVMTVNVSDPNPARAQAMARAVVNQFVHQEVAKLTQRDNAIMQYEQGQMNTTLRALGTTEAQVSSSSGSNLSPGAAASDSALAGTLALAQQYSVEQQQYNQAASDLASVGSPSVLGVIDPPGPALAKSRMKTLLFAGVGGVLGGLVILFAALAVLMAMDTSVRAPADLDGEPALRVVGAVEHSQREQRNKTWA